VTRGWLPQRAGSPIPVSGRDTAAVPLVSYNGGYQERKPGGAVRNLGVLIPLEGVENSLDTTQHSSHSMLVILG